MEGVPRQAYNIATKVSRTSTCEFDFSAENAINSVESSINKLGCGYLDVIQVHDVEFADNIEIILNETLPALDKMRCSGKVRFIGITGYSLSTLKY